MRDLAPKPSFTRLPNEGRKAFQAFVLYRDLGSERTLRGVAKKLQRSLTLLGRWSSKYDWVARCRAYDEMVDERKRRRQIRAIEEMAERHAGQFVLMQQKAIEKLLSMTPEEVNELTPEQIIRWLTDGANGERKARGLPEFTSANKTALTGPDGRAPVQIQPVRVTEVIVRSRAELAAARANLPEGVEILSMQ